MEEKPGKKVPTFIKAGLLELLVICGLIVIIVGILSYLHFLPNFFPGKTNQTNPQVQVVSDLQGYSLRLQNSDKLVQLLNSWKTFSHVYKTTYGLGGDMKNKPLEKIVIHLVGTDQKTNSYATPQGQVYSSSLTNASPGQFDMQVYMGAYALESTRQNFRPEMTFQETFLTSLYRITHPSLITQGYKSTQDALSAEYKTNPLMTTQYFVINKGN